MIKHAIATFALLAFSGCGGECPPGGCGASGFHIDIPPNASPAGIWIGSDVQSNLPVTAMIGEDQVAYMVRSDDTVFVGAITNAFEGQFWAYAPLGAPWSDGSSFGSGAISARVSFSPSTATEQSSHRIPEQVVCSTATSRSLTRSAIFMRLPSPTPTAPVNLAF